MATLALGLSKEATQADVYTRLGLILAELSSVLDVAVSNFPSSFAVSNFPGATAVSNFPATYNTRALARTVDKVDSYDSYIGGEVLADQAGAGAALTFTFALSVDLIFVFVKSAGGTSQGRADPFGGTPTASQGIPCEDGAVQPIPVVASSVKVFAPTGTTVSVWGYRYG